MPAPHEPIYWYQEELIPKHGARQQKKGSPVVQEEQVLPHKVQLMCLQVQGTSRCHTAQHASFACAWLSIKRTCCSSAECQYLGQLLLQVRACSLHLLLQLLDGLQHDVAADAVCQDDRWWAARCQHMLLEQRHLVLNLAVQAPDLRGTADTCIVAQCLSSCAVTAALEPACCGITAFARWDTSWLLLFSGTEAGSRLPPSSLIIANDDDDQHTLPWLSPAESWPACETAMMSTLCLPNS